MDWFSIGLAVLRIVLAGVVIVYSLLRQPGKTGNVGVRRAGLLVAMAATASGVNDLVVSNGRPLSSGSRDNVTGDILMGICWLAILWFFWLERRQQRELQ